MACANAQPQPWLLNAIKNLRKSSSKKPSKQRKLHEDLVTQHAAECVEELLNTVHENRGVPWFLIIEKKMRRLAKTLRK